MSTAEVAPQKDTQLKKQQVQFNSLRKLLERGKSQLELAMSKHLDADRMIRLALTAATRNPKLFECTQESIGLALLTASQLGLEPNGRDGHLIPYRIGKSDRFECQFLCDFKGLIKLAYRNPRVQSFSAAAVHENDEFDFVYGTDSFLRHRPKLTERGKLICAYAICKLKDADSQFVVMGKEDIEKRQKLAKTDKFWNAWPDEMWAKTAVKMLSKFVPLGDEFEKAVEHDNALDSDTVMNVTFTETKPETITDDRPKSEQLADELDEKLNGKKSKEKKSNNKEESTKPQLYEMFAADMRAAAAKKDRGALIEVKNRAADETRIPNGLPLEDFQRLTVLFSELNKSIE